MQKEAIALDLIRQRKFPAYTYATIDEAWATRRLLRRHKHKPLGLTCCLDEAAIFAALVLPLANRTVDDIVFIGSPAHYCVLAWTAESAWWFYSKRELHSPSTWSQLVAATCAGDAQMAFDDRLPNFDRIVTASGSYAFTTGETSIPESQLAAIITRIDAFFGIRLSQLDLALQRPTQQRTAANVARMVEDMASASGAEGVGLLVRRAALDEGHPAALRALYAFRTLDVPDLSIYLQAARHSSQISGLPPKIETVDDAIRTTGAITVIASIFDDP